MKGNVKTKEQIQAMLENLLDETIKNSQGTFKALQKGEKDGMENVPELQV